jgi:hypothetical protein
MGLGFALFVGADDVAATIAAAQASGVAEGNVVTTEHRPF